MEFKKSKTEKNLLAAFAGESQARNRYTYFASEARKAGYEQISAIFLETADNEKEHAKLFFNLLKGGETEILAAYPAGVTADTAANLKAAAAGENFEWTTLYQNFARHLVDESPWIWLYNGYNYAAMQDKVQGYIGTPLVSRITGRPSLCRLMFSSAENGRRAAAISPKIDPIRRASSPGMKSKGVRPTISSGV